ncbi:MAG: hypothetical protein EA422_15280, partial [Gemmatimonadales bacterium]
AGPGARGPTDGPASSLVRIRWNAEHYPLLTLRDPATGRVVGRIRGGDVQLRDPGLSGLEVEISDGVRVTRESVRLR